MLGTVDSVLRNTLPYGQNRLWFEEQLLNNFENLYILRLSALIHKNITKNVLYDLKHQCYLDKINLNARLQWYDLTNLKTDIDYSLNNKIQVRNLVSEGIFNQEIIDKFFPGTVANTDDIINVPLLPWTYTKDEIFKSMQKYING